MAQAWMRAPPAQTQICTPTAQSDNKPVLRHGADEF
jgi:hypothetical protein